jgi:homoserine dehydrogenase
MINVAIMGYGTIGSGVFQVIKENNKVLKEEVWDDIQVKLILDHKDIEDEDCKDKQVKDFSLIENDPEINIVVETMGGLSPAYDFVKRCLLAGKHVVTSNKALVAAYGTELLKIAAKNNVNFMFEASVGGGIPVIRTMAKAFAGERIKEIKGILNGTTNFILSKMDDENESFEEALKEAQDLGYAEKNPEADVEGYDTCRKIAILSSLATGKEVNYEEIYTEGITRIEKIDFAYAKKLNSSIKLLGCSSFISDKLYSYVCPVLVSKDDPLFMVRGVFNGIMVEGNMLGKSMLYGSGAGKLPTASAVVADIISCARHKKINIPMGWNEDKLKVEDFNESVHKYLVRVKETDENKVREIFGEVEIIKIPEVSEYAFLTDSLKENEFTKKANELGGVIKFIRG